MSDEEFDVLDELYFVKPFQELNEECDLPKPVIFETLDKLYSKGWVKVLSTPDEEVMEKISLEGRHEEFYYLATKLGLLKHNQA